MNCYKHPDREAVANCSLCGKPICEECLVEIAGRPYCKDCVNKIVTQSIMEKSAPEALEAQVPAQKEIIETHQVEEPVVAPQVEEYTEAPKTETITPLKPKEIEEEAKINTEKLTAAPQVEKAPENFETDYEYETEYVETYDEGGEEDKYYENPDLIPEPIPKPEQYGLQSEPIIINPVSNDEKVKAANAPQFSTGKYPPEKPNQEVEIALDTNQDPNPALEAKYEKYLEDLYFDEPAAPQRQQNKQVVRQQYREPVREPVQNKRYREPQYQENPYIEPQNRKYAQKKEYDSQGQAYINQNYDDSLIIPAHNGQQSTESYEELKRRIERNYAKEEEQNKKRLFRRSKKSKEPRYDDFNINNLQEMHGIKEDDGNGISATEIVLTVILILLIMAVLLYIVYLFTLSGDYTSFFESINGLITDPTTFYNNLIN